MTKQQQKRTDAFAPVRESVMLHEKPKQKFATPGPKSVITINGKRGNPFAQTILKGRK